MLDPKALERLDRVASMGDRTLVARLVALFLEDTPERLRALREASERHDEVAIRAIAHGLRGSSETFGAHQMVAECSFLELMPPNSTAPTIEPHVAALLEAFTCTKIALEALAARQPG